MLLRRMTQHVKDQNWFAVFLDFVIVVVGVFIGIQVANWNEARSEAAKETQALNAILDDLRIDQGTLENALDMAKVNLDAANHVFTAAQYKSVTEVALPVSNLSVLEGDTFRVEPTGTIPESEKSHLWKRITIHYYPTQSGAALGALIAAGNLGLIKDPVLVKDLQQYVLLWRSLEKSNDTTFRTFRDRAVFAGQSVGLSPFMEIDESELVALFVSNPELVGAVRTMHEFTILHHRQIERVFEQNTELIRRIESRLN